MSDEEMAQLRERVARIEETQENQDRRLDIIQSDIRVIRTFIDQMRGGKMTVMILFALIGAAAALFGISVSKGH